jgi:hypothetical protein
MDGGGSSSLQETPLIWVFLCVVFVSAYLAMHYKKSKYPMVYVTATVDKEQYFVRNLPDKEEAANRLAHVRAKLLRLRTYLQQTHKEIPFVKQLLKNFDFSPIRFTESTPDAHYTSYTVNKGENVYMCLRQRNEKEELVSENVLVFVALHEMGHVGTQSLGHEADFWNNFAWLLKQAEHVGIYEYTDFAAHPVEYCGVHITDSPTYKQDVKDGINGKAVSGNKA